MRNNSEKKIEFRPVVQEERLLTDISYISRALAALLFSEAKPSVLF